MRLEISRLPKALLTARRLSSIHLLLVAIAIAVSGCTSVQLAHSTEGQVATLSDVRTQVVLNNLAMFTRNPNAVPAQVAVTQGSIVIADTANPSFSYTWSPISKVLGISVSRSWQESWTVVPVTNYGKLKVLRDIYSTCANGPPLEMPPGNCPRKKPAGKLPHKIANILQELPQNEDTLEISEIKESLLKCKLWLGSGNAPGGYPFGHYGTTFVWVKKGGSQYFGNFVMQVLNTSGQAALHQAQTFPGAIMPHAVIPH